MSLSNDLKAIIIQNGRTLTSIVEELNTLHNTNLTVQNFSSKLKRETLRYNEVKEILNIIGYNITWEKK